MYLVDENKPSPQPCLLQEHALVSTCKTKTEGGSSRNLYAEVVVHADGCLVAFAVPGAVEHRANIVPALGLACLKRGLRHVHSSAYTKRCARCSCVREWWIMMAHITITWTSYITCTHGSSEAKRYRDSVVQEFQICFRAPIHEKQNVPFAVVGLSVLHSAKCRLIYLDREGSTNRLRSLHVKAAVSGFAAEKLIYDPRN